ncbi:regulator of microtubule dynamics protein 1-like isoform X1 [Bacillus rossius redtenbacheri]
MVLFGLIKTSPLEDKTWSKEEKKQQANTRKMIREADCLFEENKYAEAYKLLVSMKDSDDVEVLWRICRALFSMSKQTDDKELKKKHVFEAFETAQKALELDDNHYAAHKWYAILVDVRMSYDGIRARVNHLMIMKKHMLRAIELNPEDATTLYMLGFWCFSIADLPWYQRKIASAVFSDPPTSTYEEALQYFLRAEEKDPNFYSQNLLMLGKTYLRMKNLEKASHYLKLAAAYPLNTEDDAQANKEATELLKKIKV